MVWGLYIAGEPILAALVFGTVAAIVILFAWARFYNWRFVFPGVAAIALFILVPVIYTSAIGFTNFGSRNLLTLERVQDYHLAKLERAPGSERPFALTADGPRLFFPASGDRPALITPPIADAVDRQLAAEVHEGDPPETLPVREALKIRALLQSLSVTAPDGSVLTMSGSRDFATSEPVYTLGADGVLTAGTARASSPITTPGSTRPRPARACRPGGASVSASRTSPGS